MKVYNYDSETKVFTGTTDAMPNHVEGGYFIPAFATLKPVGVVPEGMIAIFDETKDDWVLAKNNIGIIVYNKQTQQSVTIYDLGDIAEDYTIKQPLSDDYCWNEEKNDWVLDIAKQAQRKLDEIRKQRDSLLDMIDIKKCNAERWDAMTKEQKKAWREYKQQLRDLPADVDINNPVWPKMPDEK